jgi:hypothetical protein
LGDNQFWGEKQVWDEKTSFWVAQRFSAAIEPPFDKAGFSPQTKKWRTEVRHPKRMQAEN